MARKSLGPRRHVILSTVQDTKLESLQKKTGITVSEHIRRAIDSYFRLLELADQRGKK